MSTQDKVIAIIAEQAVLEPSDVSLDSTLEDLGIDSLGLVESILRLKRSSISRSPLTQMSPNKAISIYRM